LDKSVEVGEFWAEETNGVAQDALFTKLYDGGYSGAWAWQYANDDNGMNTKWPAMQAPMKALYQAHPSAIDCSTP
jgi:hypothetical protein